MAPLQSRSSFSDCVVAACGLQKQSHRSDSNYEYAFHSCPPVNVVTGCQHTLVSRSWSSLIRTRSIEVSADHVSSALAPRRYTLNSNRSVFPRRAPFKRLDCCIRDLPMKLTLKRDVFAGPPGRAIWACLDAVSQTHRRIAGSFCQFGNPAFPGRVVNVAGDTEKRPLSAVFSLARSERAVAADMQSPR